VHFCPHSSTPGKTSQSVTQSEIALGQTRLTSEFFTVGLPENKLYLGGMSILSILNSSFSSIQNILIKSYNLNKSIKSYNQTVIAIPT
jgi:hypothetical protein